MIHPSHLLQHYQIEPKQSLGQNFLFEDGVLERIAQAAELTATDAVLEIGPGLGSLTRLLAQTAVEVVAVELDQRFLPILEAELRGFPNLKLIHGDILELNPNDLFERPYKVVANIPYYITGAILRHLLSAHNKPTRMVLTVQAEVAARITAVPPDMSLLAVSCQFYGPVRQLGKVKAGSFWPRPDVDSAIVRLDITHTPDPAQEKAFFRLVRAGFSQKRKQLKNNFRSLGQGDEAIGAWLARAGIDGRRRAETLALEEWLTLVDKQQTP